MRPHLTKIQLFAYGFLSLPIAWASVLVLTFVPTYYAVELGLGLGTVGVMIVGGRLLDVITDPLIGFLSDRTRSRLGPRLPWIIAGVILFVPTSYLVLLPGPNPGWMQAGLSIGLFFLAYTILDLPYSATGLELSSHTNERTTLASVKAVFQVAGALAAALFIALNPADTGRAFTLSMGVIGVIAVIGTVLFIALVPNNTPLRAANKTRFRNRVLSIWARKDYARIMGAFLLVQSGSALLTGLTVLYVAHVLDLAALTGVFIGLVLLSSALSLPFWQGLSRRIGKIDSWKFALIFGTIILLLTPVFSMGGSVAFGIYCVLIGIILAADAVFPTTLLADIVGNESDDHTSDSAALMLGYKNAISKLSFIAPMGVAFPILGLLGFDKGPMTPTDHLWVLVFLYAIIPAVLRLGAFFVIGRLHDDASAP